MTLKDYIVPTTLKNTNNVQRYRDDSFKTKDLIYIDSFLDICDVSKDDRIVYPTDYAVMNGAFVRPEIYGPLKRKPSITWLRSESRSLGVEAIASNGDFVGKSVDSAIICVRPALRLNFQDVVSLMEKIPGIFRIGNNGKYHTIEFGEYPKTYVGDRENHNLEMLFSSGKIKATGKTYISSVNSEGKIGFNQEFEYSGVKYVRVYSKRYSEHSEYSDGTKAPPSGTYLWAKVEPIVWEIRNWDDLTKSINLQGKEPAQFIDVVTEEAIISGIPFHYYKDDMNAGLWQNSTIRAYLNGINVNNLQSNGNPNFTSPKGGDFSRGNSFLEEALELELIKTSTQAEVKIANRKRLVQVTDMPMNVQEQIKAYINAGQPFMLHGPSGIGKTRRIEEADPSFVSIVLRNGILPEEVIGKTIYPNNNTTTGGTWVPPAWYVKLCEICEKEPDKKHVLFIDEITNVAPHEQSLVFHLVLNNSIGPNYGKLPQNAVVVAAGNNKEESEAAYNMPEPLFRRFYGHINLDLDIQNWLEWGSELTNGQPKIHPIVSSFVATYGIKVFYSKYDPDNPPKYAIDPRAWEQISNIIYANNGTIAKELIENKIGPENTASFIAFAKNPPLSLEEILNHQYSDSDIPVQFDAQYALALSLRTANEEEVSTVREFILKELGSEILAMFDTAWVGKDNERAILIDELSSSKKFQKLKDKAPEIKKKEAPDYKITVDKFLKSKQILGIRCDSDWKIDCLISVFAKMGKKWNKLEKSDTTKEVFGDVLYFKNNGGYMPKSFLGTSAVTAIYDFSEVDISKYLNAEEQKEVKQKLQLEELRKVMNKYVKE